MSKLDLKFYGTVRKAKDDTVVPEDEWCVFLAQDNCFARMLPIYRDLCDRFGCDVEQLAAVDELIARVSEWRHNNPDECKYPDAEGERLLKT